MRWAEHKYQIHRNLSDMSVCGDGSNVRLSDQDFEQTVAPERFVCHHFGMVRWTSRLRQKLRVVGQIKQGTLRLLNLPGFIFDLLPYNWFDEDFLEDLAIYDGPLIEPVRRNPQEFTRDKMKLHRYLLEKAPNTGKGA